MGVPVVMPQLGLTMTEGSVSEWLKKPGDFVRKGDMLFIVSTDKADMEVESLDEGKLAQIVVEPGNVVPVGTVIAYLGEPGPATIAPAASPAAIAKMELPGTVTTKSSTATKSAEIPAEGLPASPRARKLARDLGVDISKVSPSGGRDRIVEDDVRRYAAGSSSQVAAAPSPDTRRRRLIAERLTQSLQTIPHFSLSVEVRADALVSLREGLKSGENVKTTVTDLLLKAVGLALKDTPGMLAVWENGQARAVDGIDLGMAFGAQSGVVAPVLRNAAALNVGAIALWRNEVVAKAREGRLALTDLEGGIGTLSNLGIYRVDQFQAVITPGQSFILAVGKIARRPWVDGEQLIVAQTLNLTLTVDHRVADGALAAQFLERIADQITNPTRLHAGPVN